MGRETYFPHLAILVPERQSCACLRGKKYTLRKIITRHSDHVPRLNLHSPAAPPVPHFPRFRALALFGRRPPQRVDSLVMPASENLHSNGLMHSSNQPFYSITASARPSSGSGTVSPRDFAVLRLKTNSTFVVCCTGRLSGFSPLRMRPA